LGEFNRYRTGGLGKDGVGVNGGGGCRRGHIAGAQQEGTGQQGIDGYGMFHFKHCYLTKDAMDWDQPSGVFL
jgi:hypothetical protein